MSSHQPAPAPARNVETSRGVSLIRPQSSTSVRCGYAARVVAAALALLIGWLHVVDQGGPSSLKTPAYVGVGYWLLELGALVLAGVLLFGGARHRLVGWVVALGVAGGPMVGYALSRGPGLPGYVDDRGNWGEAIGIQALTTEAALLVLAALVLLRSRRRAIDSCTGGRRR